MLKCLKRISAITMMLVSVTSVLYAASQDKYSIPEPYKSEEVEYLKKYPDLQKVMDYMIETEEKVNKKPTNNILHNRICTTLVYEMAKTDKLNKKDTRLAIAGDLLHNICKADKVNVMTKPEMVTAVGDVVKDLRKHGLLKGSPEFWTNTELYKNPKIGNNLGLMHHLSGAYVAGKFLRENGFKPKEVRRLEAAIIEHSTGYWYFRSSINQAVGNKDGWKVVYPDPENTLSKYIHDADLVSQFVPASVVPEGSKWRVLAINRWGAKNKVEEGQIVYYVFDRLYGEARTPIGKVMAKEKWEQIAPQLVELMGLKPGEDPIKVLGVPKIFAEQ